MINLKSKALVAAAAVALVQTAVLGAMVYDRIQLLRKGTEIELPAVPVDPRSLFRGDYVILSYPVSRFPNALVPADPPLRRGERVYVTIGRAADSAWTALAVDRVRPASAEAGRVVLEARVQWNNGARGETMVRYGLESYFVPEGQGKPLEKLVGDRKLSVVVAVDAKGRSAIKGLVIDGKRVYDEPLI